MKESEDLKMNEYVEDLMLRIAEKNSILKGLSGVMPTRTNSTNKICGELDSLLYEFYKSLIYFNYNEMDK